jgi:diguanylate cyclase (GGDEF)-like protein/PAS domain S-box-containing protein
MTAELQDLVSLCPDPIIGVNRAGVIILFNVAAERLLGYRGEEVLDRLAITQVYASAERAREIKKLLYASPDRQIEGYETSLLSRGGRVIDIRLSAKLLLRNGEEFGSIGFFHDLTERKQLESKLKQLSITDSLTGLYNQRHFHAVLEAELERARRYRRPLSLVCIDLNHFKQVNDLLGHLEGDSALRFTARTIQKHLRKTDIAFRYGGDEFMLLLPETSGEEAGLIGDRVRASFDRCWADEWAAKANCPIVSLSIGIAEFDQHESAEGLIRRADTIMYDAKRRAAATETVGQPVAR